MTDSNRKTWVPKSGTVHIWEGFLRFNLERSIILIEFKLELETILLIVTVLDSSRNDNFLSIFSSYNSAIIWKIFQRFILCPLDRINLAIVKLVNLTRFV